MGKKQHQKDKLYLTTSEWKSIGGHKDDTGTRLQRAQFKRLPINHCSLSLLPFEDPVCARSGEIFELTAIVPYVKKHGKNPCTGKPLAAKDLIHLKFDKGEDGNFRCPDTHHGYRHNWKRLLSRSDSGVRPPQLLCQSQSMSVLTELSGFFDCDISAQKCYIADEDAKKVAKDLLNQIETTPGRISLNQASCAVCPIPPILNQKVSSDWTIAQLQEGQMGSLLASTEKNFKPLGIEKLYKVDVKTELLPRQMNLKDAINQLKQVNKSDDQYVGFAVAVANILRRCDNEAADKLVQSITSAVEIEASNIINKQ